MNEQTRRAMQRHYHVAFRALCAETGHKPTNGYRHQVAEWILGYDKSSSQWTGKEYSLVIDQLKDWLRGGIEPHPLSKTEQARRSHGETQKQLIHAISQLAPDQYIQAICNDRHSRRPWRHLTAFQLTRLRYTITRAAAAANKKGHPLA
jgi:hypothetical protein